MTPTDLHAFMKMRGWSMTRLGYEIRPDKPIHRNTIARWLRHGVPAWVTVALRQREGLTGAPV